MNGKRLEELISEAWASPRSQMWYQGQWRSSDWLFRASETMECSLREAGFGAGQRLLALLPVCPEFHALSLACWRLGGTIVPVNTAAGIGAIESVVRRADASLAVLGPETLPHKADMESWGQPCANVSPEGELSSVKVRATQQDDPETAVIFFTSGTTGVPKGVPLTHGNLRSNIESAVQHAIELTDDMVMLNVLPNFHALGCVVSGWLPLVAGIKQAMVRSFLPVSAVVEAAQASHANLSVMVPTMLHFLVGTLLKARTSLPDMRLVISGGDRLATNLELRAREVFSGARLVEGYGVTESSPVLAVTALGREHRTGTVGTFLPGVEYKLQGLDGKPAQGNEGELWVRGPSITTHYFRDPENTALRFKDGWFGTDDQVRIDPDGTITILERVSDLIIVGGFSVYPQEVEAVLASHPAVRQAAVVGHRQSVSGEVVRGFVVLADGASVSSSELIEWCRQRLPHFKVPRKIEFLSELPVNALGKVLRRKLRELCEKEK